MKRLFVIASVVLVSGRVVQAQVEPQPQEVRQRDTTACELVRTISFKLPRQNGLNLAPQTDIWSWDVLYRPQFHTIEIRRDQPVATTSSFTGINDGGIRKREPVSIYPEFSFEVQPFVTPEEYNRYKAENNAIDEQLDQMRREMKNINRKFDRHLPKTEDEKKKVDAYNRLKSSRHFLPDFYFRGISLSWARYEGIGFAISRRPGHNPALVTSTELMGWRREQADAAQAVLKLLSRYEPEEK